MNPHPLVQFLQKPASEFTKEDILRYIEENQIEMINFRYVAGDGRLKTLNFVVNDLDYVKTILSCGERVDGSSLFKNLKSPLWTCFAPITTRTGIRLKATRLT